MWGCLCPSLAAGKCGLGASAAHILVPAPRGWDILGWDILVASVGCVLAAGDSLLLAMALPEVSGVEGLPCQGRVVIACSKLCGHPTGAQTAEQDREALVRHSQRLIHRLFCQSRDSCKAFFSFPFSHMQRAAPIFLYTC